MSQLPVEHVDDSKIQNSSLLKIFNIQDETILDSQLALRNKPEFSLLIKKIILLLIGRSSGLLSEKASEILSDHDFVKSLFEMNPNLERLKTILKFEMDDRVKKTDEERLRLNLMSYDELKSRYLELLNQDKNTNQVNYFSHNGIDKNVINIISDYLPYTDKVAFKIVDKSLNKETPNLKSLDQFYELCHLASKYRFVERYADEAIEFYNTNKYDSFVIKADNYKAYKLAFDSHKLMKFMSDTLKDGKINRYFYENEEVVIKYNKIFRIDNPEDRLEEFKKFIEEYRWTKFTHRHFLSDPKNFHIVIFLYDNNYIELDDIVRLIYTYNTSELDKMFELTNLICKFFVEQNLQFKRKYLLLVNNNYCRDKIIEQLQIIDHPDDQDFMDKIDFFENIGLEFHHTFISSLTDDNTLTLKHIEDFVNIAYYVRDYENYNNYTHDSGILFYFRDIIVYNLPNINRKEILLIICKIFKVDPKFILMKYNKKNDDIDIINFLESCLQE